MKGKLVVLEGIDGVGKTSLALSLKQALQKQGIKTVIYEDIENRYSAYNQIKSFIKGKVNIEASFLFYLSSALYKSMIINKLLNSSWVICDRYIYSTLAYHQVRCARVKNMVNLKKLPLKWPNYYFLIKISEKVRKSRLVMKKHLTKQDLIPNKRGNIVNRMEKVLASFNPVIIDNSGPIKETIDKILVYLFR